MTLRRVLLHAAVWLCVYALWLTATRRFHPTWTVAASATAILVAASALAVYLDALVLRPRLARRRLWAQYALSLLAAVAVLDVAAVLSIGAVYDRLWRPDPLRFGFWFNVLSDGVIIVLHLLAAAWLARLRGRQKRARPAEN